MPREIVLTYDVTNSERYNTTRLKEYLCANVFIYSHIFITDNSAIEQIDSLEALRNYFLTYPRNLNAINRYLELEFPTASTILIKLQLLNMGVEKYYEYTEKLVDLLLPKSNILYFYLGLVTAQNRNNVITNISGSNSKTDWDVNGEQMLISVQANLSAWTQVSHVWNRR